MSEKVSNKSAVTDSIIQEIEQAETPASVTNVMIARVLDALNSEIKKLAPVSTDLSLERLEREAAINKLQTAIDQILSLDNSEAIESLNELLAFVRGFKDSDTLSAYLAKSDLTIRGNTKEIDSLKIKVANLEASRVTKQELSGAVGELEGEIENVRSGLADEISLVTDDINNLTNDLANHIDESNESQAVQNVKIEELSASIDAITGSPEQLKNAKNLCVASWENDDLSPESVETFGDKKFLQCWEFFLIDCTAPANDDGTLTPVGKLKRNNLLRFADGSFAPTVGITEAMRAECDVDLYLDQQGKNKYCQAGKFNPTEFYQTHGLAKLYKANGSEVRVLRPWETTETKYTIVLANTRPLWLIDTEVGESGMQWKGLLSAPIKWDGIDCSAWKLPPTGMFPSLMATVGDKARCFFFLYTTDKNCSGSVGDLAACNLFNEARTYPRHTDITAMSCMRMARANNNDPKSPFPFAEAGYHARNAFITAIEVLHGTKYLHGDTFFGSGVSGNTGAAGYQTAGGVRCRPTGEDTWQYSHWGQSNTGIHISATATSNTVANAILNKEAPKEQCMESQMAYSFAVESGIAENTEFDFYGGKYWYTKVPGADADRMNVKVYKSVAQTGVAGWNTSNEPTEYDIECVLRMSLYAGMSLCGDVFSLESGDIELVGYDGGADNDSIVKIYAEPDQRKWLYTDMYRVPKGDEFPFQSSYRQIGEYTTSRDTANNASTRHRVPHSPARREKGGSLTTAECAHTYQACGWYQSSGDYVVRVACRSRGYASYSSLSPRFLYAYSSAGSGTRLNCGSAQVLLNVQQDAVLPQADTASYSD